MSPKTKRSICAFCIAMSSAFGFSVVYAYSTYYVAFQTATGFTNTQMGLLITVLGIASTILYIPGGFLADRYDVKKLTIVGLIGAGAVAFGISAFPTFPVMLGLYILFTVFAVLLGWNAQIKMINMLGDDQEQGRLMSVRAYGKTLPLLVISLGGSALLAMLSDRQALMTTLYLYGGLAIVSAIIACITFDPVQEDTSKTKPIKLVDYIDVLKRKDVWLIGLIGFCAYTASAGVTYLQPYLAETLGLTSSLSSVFAIIAKNCAVIASPILTWLGARKNMSVTKAIGLSMIAAAVCFAIYALIPSNSLVFVVAIALYMVAALCIMGCWALQYVPVSEVGIPLAITGTAIGVISMFSFVSDIFYSAICGYFLDNFGMNGYKAIFGMTIGLMIIGCIASFTVVGIMAKKEKS